jgi:endonuclease III-like uncharacterized protein
VQTIFMELLPRDRGLYNEYHALIVVHSKDVCKKKPLCEVCCLSGLCTQLAGFMLPCDRRLPGKTRT